MALGVRSVGALLLLLAAASEVQAVESTLDGPTDACVTAGPDPKSISVNPKYCADTAAGMVHEVVGRNLPG